MYDLESASPLHVIPSGVQTIVHILVSFNPKRGNSSVIIAIIISFVESCPAGRKEPEERGSSKNILASSFAGRCPDEPSDTELVRHKEVELVGG
jgi:hypothetical protein